ncbi:MAG: S24 family peptidase [Acidobacteriota bacterium]
MLPDTYLTEGIRLQPCRADFGLAAVVYRASFGARSYFDPEERTEQIPADITGLNAQPSGWVVLELIREPELVIVTVGDLLAVRRTRTPRNGQIAIVKTDEQVLIRRVFANGTHAVLRSLAHAPDILTVPAAVEVRGTIEGLALEGCWYKLITSEQLPER